MMSPGKTLSRPLSALGLHLTVFLASGAVMVVELTAGRLVARYLGVSIHTWTAIIGVVFAGMSFGNYLGGRIADRNKPVRILGVLFLIAAIWIAAVPPLNDILVQWRLLWALPWPIRICTHVSLLLLGPAALLGSFTPVVAKMALGLGRGVGRTMGGLYACGAAGSILGTFLTGFWLVLLTGVWRIFLGVASIMGAMAVCYGMAAFRAGLIHAQCGDEASGTKRVDCNCWTRFGPCATLFTVSAAFMTLELAASRLVSWFFGASLYTWTAVIGVALAGTTLGNYLGGRLGDRAATKRTVALLFLLASLYTFDIPLLSTWTTGQLGDVHLLKDFYVPTIVVIVVTVSLLLPCVFLGCITPVIAKRALGQASAQGRTVGDIYAWGAVGCVVGTFLAGYLLIGWLGPPLVIEAVALILACLAFVYWLGHTPLRAAAVGLAGVGITALVVMVLPARTVDTLCVKLALRAPEDPTVVLESDSDYSHIAVKADPKNPNLREMVLDALAHSKVDLADPTRLCYDYEWIHEAVTESVYPYHLPVTAMVLGGGGYTFPRYLEVTRPGSYIEVVEIDGSVTEAAYEAFGLPEDTAIVIHTMDARNRVTDLVRRKAAGERVPAFDCILGDAVNDFAVPYHLTTLEFVQDIHRLLGDTGVYLLTIIDCLSSGGFLAAVANTCQEVFPFVYVFDTGRAPTDRDTFVVVSSKAALDLTHIPERIRDKHEYVCRQLSSDCLDRLIERHKGLLLTDDYAPVENLLAPVVAKRGPPR